MCVCAHIRTCECSDHMWQFPQPRRPRQPSTADHTSVSISPPLPWRTSLRLFIHYLSSSSSSTYISCSALLLIGEPVPIPVTAALAIRSAVGLFKAWGTRGLDLLRHLCTSNAAINHTKATWTKKLQTIKHQNTLIWRRRAARHTFCCTFEEVEWGFCIKYAWAHVAG